MNREIIPCGSINASVQLPGSKYIANRLVPLAALASSESNLANVVDNNDINTAIAGLTQLGYQFNKRGDQLQITPRGTAPNTVCELYTAHSGTFSRFVTAIAALESVPVQINCSDKMATRPMIELFEALAELKAEVKSENQCLPAQIKGPLKGDQCQLDASRSSQYLSALLIVAPFLQNGLKIQLTGELVSRAYVDMTVNLMQKMGVEVIEEGNCFSVKPGQIYNGIDFTIPGDPVSSTYFMGIAAIAGGEIRIRHFDFESVQGEARFYQVLEQMGVAIARENNDLIVKSDGNLQAIEVDMGGMPDAVQTLAAVACFAEGTTRIT
ncbi:MAG: 3-phosphoshikimate 1-carboxyvinyltransferase, partial [Kangiellaceae bacterium]|nr:3-phosphoshikimate 1-carboxyvinyltransferase [Kangiellaceae bacterium]